MTTTTTTTTTSGTMVRVLYVDRKNAKTVKVGLEKNGLLHKKFRMTAPAGSGASTRSLDGCIAIPVHEEYFTLKQDEFSREPWRDLVVDSGTQVCPYSTSILGNRSLVVVSTDEDDLTLVQQALVHALEACCRELFDESRRTKAISKVKNLPISVCPKKLEFMGDDRTLVIPRKAMDANDAAFREFMLDVVGPDCFQQKDHRDIFWRSFATTFQSPRVVRRGDIDPDSRIRESGHRLLWPQYGIPGETGPGSPGWITITEQGIAQSFDMTRVMFSRGNITEKIRFGKLVQPGEVVLDMYAGIGYYTLPALVHGKASQVVACEWNEHAASALKYNLEANGVSDRATVYVGDSRVICREHNLTNMFDRVSLGLLPSSEGGWRSAVRALRRDKGGWLHVHGNVPDVEVENWTLWMCSRLVKMVDTDDWIVLCTNVQRVKSFAPQIHHYVADVFVGPPQHGQIVDMGCHRAGFIHKKDASFVPVPDEIQPPSCALCHNGVLNQTWMMDDDES